MLKPPTTTNMAGRCRRSGKCHISPQANTPLFQGQGERVGLERSGVVSAAAPGCWRARFPGTGIVGSRAAGSRTPLRAQPRPRRWASTGTPRPAHPLARDSSPTGKPSRSGLSTRGVPVSPMGEGDGQGPQQGLEGGRRGRVAHSLSSSLVVTRTRATRGLALPGTGSRCRTPQSGQGHGVTRLAARRKESNGVN